MSGGSLTTSGAITFANDHSYISGYGTITNGGAISGAGTITAIGGGAGNTTLAINGAVSTTSTPTFVISSSSASELLFNGTATIAASNLNITSANQTLGVGIYNGTPGNLTITGQETVYGGTIALSGGTLTDTSGIVLGNGSATAGTITGYGTIAAGLTGSGTGTNTITATGGILTFTKAVDASGNLTPFAIASGSTLVFDSGVGTSSIKPTTTFNNNSGDTGTLNLTADGNLSTVFTTIHGFTGTTNGTSSTTSDNILVAGSGAAGDKVVWNQALGTLTVENAGGATLGRLNLSGTYTQGQFNVTESGATDYIWICFMAGTLVRTPDGEVAIETLKPGDLVLTSEGVARPVNWLGKQTVSTHFADPVRSLPIRVKAGALAENVPSRDLLVSPDHALLVDNVLIHAGALVNGSSITRETNVPRVFVYYHVELDDHSLILAENTPAETFVDNVDRMNFDNWAEFEALYPEGKSVEELPFPRAKAHRQVPVYIRVALADRAQVLGLAIGAGETAVA